MKIISTISLIIWSANSYAQASFYDTVTLGNYSVGFQDSLIFCDNEQFSQYEYEGNSPLFLQIWHPISETKHKERLRIQDLRKRKLSNELETVYSALCQKMDSAFVWYYIMNDFVNYDTINYGKYSFFDVLDTLKKYETRSYLNKIQTNADFPVIIYHHGAQGLSDENFVLSEYFASRGYIVVSSNYHLPYEKETYGSSQGSENEDIALTKRVIEFSRSLSSNKNVYFIGHSWGAQVGFSLLHEKEWANAFVSMETTLEFWDSTKIESTWPKLNNLMNLHEKDYSLPILMIANTGNDKPFEFFSGITNTTTIHASAKEEFGHESYTSEYLLRYLYKEQFIQPDTLELKRQLELYTEHLKLIEDFIKSCREGNQFNEAKYQANFFIQKFTTKNANKK